jgi:hypothetical protein
LVIAPVAKVEASADFLNRKTKRMARKTVYVSDLSGDTIEDGKGAKIPITFEDGRRPSYELDVTAEEAAGLGRKGR